MLNEEKDKLISAFKGVLQHGAVITDADMGRYTSFKCGGTADILVNPTSYDELKGVLKIAASSGEKYFILGNGSNVLVKDGGFRGVIIRTIDALTDLAVDPVEGTIVAQAGVLLSKVANAAADAGLSGMETISGIPGSIGGACFMNAGAYDGEMKDIVAELRLISRDGEREYTLSVEEMDYGYRHSVLYGSGDIVVSVSLKLKKDDHDKIAKRMAEFTKRRNDKQPLEKPSAGSFFKRPEGNFAGKLIEEAGLKGLTVGGAQVSTKHSGFVVNLGDATATDIVDLKRLVQARVKEQTGVMLEPEVRIIGDDIDM